MDFSKTLIRCHRLGDIMTEPRSKNESLSQTCKSYLRQLYREKKYGRRKNIISKYIDKGLHVEEDSITLYSRFRHKMFKKNEQRLNNEYLTGEPDLYEGVDINHADVIIDTKSVWDLFTLPYADDKIDNGYYWQGMGYMDLTGAELFRLPYCLVNTPDFLIQKEIDSIKWKTGIEATQEQQIKIIENMQFDNIPIQEKICEFEVKRDEKEIERMHEKINTCRDYLVFLDSPKIISVA